MFARRLKLLLILLAIPVGAIVARLVHLQILGAAKYRDQAQKMLIRPARFFPFVRGEITDRAGKRLAYDTPSWDIGVDYAAIARDEEAMKSLLARRGDTHRGREARELLPQRIDESWQAIAEFTGTPISELEQRAERIKQEVLRAKLSVERRRGVETVVTEERMVHPVVRGLNQEQQVAAKVRFAAYDWIEVLPSHWRHYEGGEAVGHILGQLGAVDARTRENDPYADDELACYRLSELHGISGAEALGEPWLRGRRGRVHENIEGQVIRPPVDPQDGRTFRLTIDALLQQAIYNRLVAAVESGPFPTGGCVVVLHVPTRQVLAMVDYPSIDPSASEERLTELYGDKIRQPLLFRAVRGYYPPGSLVKPMILAAALSEGLVNDQTQFTCYGRLFLDFPDRWRCTGTHGTIGPVFAIQHSCNVYFYHVAQLLGTPRLAEWLPRFGFGQVSGSGLVAEKPGRLPTVRSDGEARLAGIGQGRFTITPIQAANMMATLASGVYRPVSLWLDDPAPRPSAALPIHEEHWQMVREGMYLAVNAAGGTAYGSHRATLDDPEYVLLGKTGSAEVKGHTVEWTFVCHFPDGRVEEIVAPDKEAVQARYAPDEQPTITGQRWHRRYPPGEPPTHAWFTGYLAPRQRYRDAVVSGDAAIAIAVVIEYSGHGGDVAAPVARDMVQSVLLRYRGQSAGPGTREAF